MAINANDLRFDTNNILPLLTSSNWELTNATLSDTSIIIQPGGSAKCIPTQTIMNKVFMYFKVEIDFNSNIITSISNFKNLPYVFITETYKNENNELYRNRSRALGFNTFNPVSGEDGHYIDTTIFSSLNKKLGYYSFDIRNNTDGNLIINSVGVYSSIDISDDQVGKVIDTVQSASEPDGFMVYTNDTYSNLRGLAVTLKNSEKQIKYKPVYSQGLLSSIETNFGVSYPVVYVVADIDLNTDTGPS